MEAKLCVYGCSFSFAYWDATMGAAGIPEYKISQGWPSILSEKLNLVCNNRADGGIGINTITYRLDEDILEGKTTKDDIIILSPSYFSRITLPEIDFTVLDYDRWLDFLARYSIESNKVHLMNTKRFVNKILTLKELGYKIYGWIWEEPINSVYLDLIRENLIPAPNGEYGWEKYVLTNTVCMSRPGKLDPSVYPPPADSHFSIEGHKIAAEQMYKVITN